MNKGSLFFLILFFATTTAKSQQNIRIGYFKQADDSVKNSAMTLSGELNKSKANISIVKEITSPSGADIVLISKDQLRNYSGADVSNLSKKGSEAFGIISRDCRIFITGNSSLAIGHGVSKYLYLLGFRYYFPLEDWVIYPATINFYFKIKLFSEPAFSHRYLWYGFGPGTEKVENRFQFWKKMNCLDGSLQARTGHSYDGIVDRHKKEFLAHPEWLVNTTTAGVLPPNPKFDVSKTGLIDLVIRDTRDQINPLQKPNSSVPYKMISLSPSDGIGVCNTKSCQQLGSVTDRVFYLVNAVAKNIRKDYPNILLGCLAYSEYIAPPTKPVEDNVYVSLTTAFNNSKYSLDELINLWSKKVKRLGIYDYQALYAWDYDLPGQSLASAYHLIQPSLLKYNKAGMTGYEAEINTGWINKGLGYYVSSQLLWDPKLKTSIIEEEFFNNCFQSSAAVVKKLYTEWSHFNDPFISENTLARWIDLLFEAMSKEKNQQVIKRLQQIGGYLQYLVLYNQYKGDPSQANLLKIIEQAKKHINDESLTYYPAMVVLGPKLSGFELNPLIRENLEHPFSFSLPETIQWLKQYRAGIKQFAIYEKQEPSKRLREVPGGKLYNLSLHDVKEEQNSYLNTTYFVFEKKDNNSTSFDLQADFIEGGGSKLPVIISVYPFKDYAVPQGKPLFQYNYTERKKWEHYLLPSLKKGLYVLKVEDPKKGFQLKISPEINYSLFIPDDTKQEVGYIHSLYFYVAPGTKSFKFMKSRTLTLIDPSGEVYAYANNKQEEIEIHPTPKQTGLWRLMGLSGFFKPDGIYPVFGIIPSRMLYPD